MTTMAGIISLLLRICCLITCLCSALPNRSQFSPKPKTVTGVSDTSCGRYYYYDHGTDKCEFCCDICCNAEIKGTTEQCEADCQEYTKKLRDEAAQNQQNNEQKIQNDDTSQEGSGWGDLSVSVQIAVFTVMGVIVIGLLIAIIAKRKAIVSIVRNLRRFTVDPPAIPLQLSGAPNQQDDEPDETTENLLPTNTTSPGIQEIGGEAEIRTYQQTSTFTTQEPTEWKYPTRVSLDGQQGAEQLVLPCSRRGDNTEPKMATTRL